MAYETQTNEQDFLDLNDPLLSQTTPDQDFDADLNARALPPDDKIYRVSLSLSEDGIKAKRPKETAKSQDLYIFGQITATINDPTLDKWQGFKFDSDWCSTIKMGETSKLANLMRVLGSPFKHGMNLAQMIAHAQSVLAANPICRVRIQWQAYSKDALEQWQLEDEMKAPLSDRTGKKEGIVLRSMKNFPQDEKGNHIPVATCPVSELEVPARCKVVAYLAEK